MALTVNVQHFNNTPERRAQFFYEPVPGEGIAWKPAYQNIIFRSMVLHLTEITKENIDEWMFRSRVYEQATASPPTYELDHLVDMMGMRVNVTTETRAGFFKHVRRWLEDDANRAVREYKEEKQKVTATEVE